MTEQPRASRANGQDAEDSKVSDATSVTVAAGASKVPANRVLQRVIMPRDTDPLDVRPLYLDEPDNVHSHVSSRRTVTVPKSARVSFAAYFNAFPASYWKRWTKVSEVVLRMSVRGSGRIDLYRSKPNGDMVHLQGHPVRSTRDWSSVDIRVSLAPFADGGWIWFDAFTDDHALSINDAAWTTDDLELPARKLAIGTTTFNRPADCVGALLALGEDDAVLDLVHKVFVADQGTKKIADHPRFAEAAAKLGDRLQVINQGNIGGSGGFTRGLYESIEHTNVDQILLMDDDIVLEPDSIMRASAFAAAATNPVVVGSQMLNLQSRGRLYSMGEAVNLHSFRWGSAPGGNVDHDFTTASLRQTPALHRRVDVGYNGWWMCLFPREVVERIGLPLPLFIKWDDAEYGLRAGEHGFPTVTLPGSGVWHMPWTDKSDSADWTVYFYLRNQLINAALHSPHNITKPVLKQAARDAMRRLFSMQYSTVAIEQKAIEDFLAGPSHLFDLLPTALGQVQSIRKNYSDAQFKPSQQEFPAPMLDMSAAEPLLDPPVHPAKIALRASKALLHNIRQPESTTAERPQLNVPADKSLWFILGNFDSATVSSPDGSSVAFRKRDPETFRKLAMQVVTNYRRLVREFPRMKQVYRDAVGDLTSVESWRKVYENQPQ
ncbi:MAG: glycosyltransferase [Sciscionella sp.]|nr:glycosyltransferase [Sciscionella sp.]